MSGLTLTLKAPPAIRLNMAAVTPARLSDLTERDIAAINLGSQRTPVALGDAFAIRMGDARDIRIVGATERLDHVAWALSGGALTVEGHVGAYLAVQMTGGAVVVKGSAGPWAGAGMTDGSVEIGGDAGESAGGALPGASSGMRGGLIVVRGGAGARAGDRMRRGLIVIEGKAGAHLGARMIAGTAVALGGAGAYPGYLMRRGSVILGADAEEIGPSFADCGRHDFTMLRLMARRLALVSPAFAGRAAPAARRYAGDMATLGKGEILLLG
ncbi:MAG: formylmethanofuran dehydrogenase subunit C [Hyphomicrobiales bacterium]|nr:formylmethanofuran dehydrogenase subunit C [Hyphomicrobiales bacterium]